MVARATVALTALAAGARAWAFPFGTGCEDRKRVLLLGDSLTEGLLGNACLYRRTSRAAAARGGMRPDCFHPYALRVAARFEAAGFSMPSACFLWRFRDW